MFLFHSCILFDLQIPSNLSILPFSTNSPPSQVHPRPLPPLSLKKNPMVQDLSKIVALYYYFLFFLAWTNTLPRFLRKLSCHSLVFFRCTLCVLLRSFDSKHLSFIVFCLQLILVSQDRITTQSYIYLLMTFLLTFASKVMTKVSAI